jgi:hypothetical protein
LLDQFDAHQLTAIAEFLAHTTEYIYRHAAVLRAEAMSAVGRTPVSERESASTGERVTGRNR